MNLWQNREIAMQIFNNELSDDYNCVVKLFNLFDEVIGSYTEDTGVLRVTGLINIKIHTLCHGMLSLAMDGLAQESGALFRPAIEAYEKLVYLREDPNRVEQFYEGTLPQAGDIARKINGEFKEVRVYLNNNASHFKFEYHSLRHLVQITDEGKFILRQPSFTPEVLKENLGTLAVFLIHVLYEAIAGLKQNDIEINDLVKKLEPLYLQVGRLFGK
ncbi:hypothetical protein [Metabacillus sp. FJAT-53654]|uniref:Uncharacterized protein n=1 Tax=Metabacillus rhizosphaerae TaxID=3117747 RepID=A0ABZ2MNS3_9BACI